MGLYIGWLCLAMLPWARGNVLRLRPHFSDTRKVWKPFCGV